MFTQGHQLRAAACRNRRATLSRRNFFRSLTSNFSTSDAPLRLFCAQWRAKILHQGLPAAMGFQPSTLLRWLRQWRGVQEREARS